MIVLMDMEWVNMPIPPHEERKTVRTSRYLFQVDMGTLLAHVGGCEKLNPEAEIVGCDSLEGCLKRHAKPCLACCKPVWKQKIIERNNDIIRRSRCSYFYLENGRAFHRPTCRFIQCASVPPIGTATYEKCAKKGKTPCRLCRPLPEDAQPKGQKKKALASPSGEPIQQTLQKRALNEGERQAIKRYRQASEERERLKPRKMQGQARSDAFTLTATRYAFWAATGYKTFHIRNCPKLKGVSAIKGFARYSDAAHAGYQPCRFCKPSPKYDALVSIPIDNKERGTESVEDIIAYCEGIGIRCSYHAPELILETKGGYWKMDTRKRPIRIEHKHIGESAKPNAQLHWQPRMFLSLIDVVVYIARHDEEYE